jgi:putative ATP-dependent endonuclease of OLD family
MTFNAFDGISVYFEKWRCFKSGRVGFSKVNRVNVLIGRNNCGKSTILKLFNCLCNNEFEENQSVILTRPISSFEIESMRSTSVGGISILSHFDNSQKLEFQVTNNSLKYANNIKLQPQVETPFKNNISKTNPFSEYTFAHLFADRDIVSEAQVSLPNLLLKGNGSGATSLIDSYINETELDTNLVEVTLKNAFNEIVTPELRIERIRVQRSSNMIYIAFDEENKGIISLLKSGSGFKTILLVLCFLHIYPKLIKKPISSIIYAFEELENNLHPSIQRRLYQYIEKHSIRENFVYFITTHSNIVIDFYFHNSDAQLLKVDHSSSSGSSIETLLSEQDIYSTLDLIGVKASDILQSNCIIWVEGPSDRIYLNKWIDLYTDGTISENTHYTIMFYGGKSLSHLSFLSTIDDIEKFIPVVKINPKSIVVIDSDIKSSEKKVNSTKMRIKNELKTLKSYCWITDGKEIENYIPIIEQILQ